MLLFPRWQPGNVNLCAHRRSQIADAISRQRRDVQFAALHGVDGVNHQVNSLIHRHVEARTFGVSDRHRARRPQCIEPLWDDGPG